MNPSFNNQFYNTFTNSSLANEQNLESIRNCLEDGGSGGMEQQKVPYPRGFQPRNTDVIVGKGMRSYNHVGNQMLRDLVAMRLKDYATASRFEKSHILSSVVAHVRTKGTFLKKDTETGLWFEADDFLARDKISQTFRNSLNQKNKTTTTTTTTNNNNDTIMQQMIQNDRQRMIQNDRRTMVMDSIDTSINTPSRRNSFPTQNRTDDSELCTLIERLASSLPEQFFEDSNPFEPRPLPDFH